MPLVDIDFAYRDVLRVVCIPWSFGCIDDGGSSAGCVDPDDRKTIAYNMGVRDCVNEQVFIDLNTDEKAATPSAFTGFGFFDTFVQVDGTSEDLIVDSNHSFGPAQSIGRSADRRLHAPA